MFLVQNWPFFNFFFSGNIGKENVFGDILERKHAFLGYKNNKFKQSKIANFPKGLTHRFGPKMIIFPISGNIGKENVFGDILERKVSTVNPWFTIFPTSFL